MKADQNARDDSMCQKMKEIMKNNDIDVTIYETISNMDNYIDKKTGNVFGEKEITITKIITKDGIVNMMHNIDSNINVSDKNNTKMRDLSDGYFDKLFGFRLQKGSTIKPASQISDPYTIRKIANLWSWGNSQCAIMTGNSATFIRKEKKIVHGNYLSLIHI